MSEFLIQEQRLGKVMRTIAEDRTGHLLFLLVGRWGMRGNAFLLCTMNGEILVSIKQVSQTFGTRFELYQRFEKVGTLQELSSLNVDFYYVQSLHWAVIGDIKTHQRPICQVHKKIMSMDKTTPYISDYFASTVTNDEDAPLCICIAAVLDYWLYNRKRQKTSDDFGLDFGPLAD